MGRRDSGVVGQLFGGGKVMDPQPEHVTMVYYPSVITLSQ